MKLKDHFTDSISTAGGASLSQMADKGEAFKVGLDGFFTCIVLSEALACGPLFWNPLGLLFSALLRTLQSGCRSSQTFGLETEKRNRKQSPKLWKQEASFHVTGPYKINDFHPPSKIRAGFKSSVRK